MKRLLVAPLLVIGIAICGSRSGNAALLQARPAPLQFQQEFRQAVQAQKSGQLEIAVRDYQRVIRLQPELAEAHANLGLIYYLQAKFKKSSGELTQAARLKPGLRGTNLFLGMDYIRLQRPHRAIPYLKRAVKEEPSNSQARLSLGTALWNDRQPSAALRDLRDAAGLFPKNINVLYALGEAYQKSANRQLEQLPPKYARMVKKGAPPQWSNPDSLARRTASSAPYLQASAAFQRQDFPAAESKLVAILNANSSNAEARYLLAKTYQKLSLSTLSRMYQINPNSYLVHQLMGRIYEDQWQNDKALAEYRTAERMRPALPGLHLAIGEVLWREEQMKPALAEFEAEIKVNPYDARSYAEIGTLLVNQHDSTKAISYLDKALQLQPDMLLVHKQLGIAYYQQKDYTQAIQQLQKAAPVDRDGSIHYLLGTAYRDSGRTKEAAAEMAQSRRIEANAARHAEAVNADALSPKP